MKTFKQYFEEATIPPVDNWKELLQDNDMLATGVRLLRAIEKLGGEALIVGGTPRDLILGKPIKDVDIASSLPVEKIRQHFKTNDIGGSGQFGITMVHYGGHEFEVSQYRSDAATSADNRRPDSVTMVNSFSDDSSRRDFGVNSLGINSKGEIIDYQNGLKDLKNGIIKAVGNPRERFTEDSLRILRLFRFSAKLGFKIDDETKQAAKELGHLIDNLSMERISDELMKISGDGKQLTKYIEYLDDVGLLERILPEVKALQGKLQNPTHHPEGAAYEHVLSALRTSRSSNPTTNLSILFHDIAKGIVEQGMKDGYPTYHGHDKEGARMIMEIGTRLKFPKKITDAIAFAAENHMKFHNLDSMSKKKISELVLSPYWPILKDTAYADDFSRGSAVDAGTKERFNMRVDLAERIAQELTAGQGKAELEKRIKEKIDGHAVMQLTGLQPGPELGSILKSTKDWLYDNLDASNNEVKDFVMSLFQQTTSKQPASLEECYEVMLNEQKTL